MREKFTPTETQRMANRMGFNIPEDTIRTAEGDLVGLGLLGKNNLVGGAIRTHKRPPIKRLDQINRRQLSKQNVFVNVLKNVVLNPV
eukprot:UN18784